MSSTHLTPTQLRHQSQSLISCAGMSLSAGAAFSGLFVCIRDESPVWTIGVFAAMTVLAFALAIAAAVSSVLVHHPYVAGD